VGASQEFSSNGKIGLPYRRSSLQRQGLSAAAHQYAGLSFRLMIGMATLAAIQMLGHLRVTVISSA